MRIEQRLSGCRTYRKTLVLHVDVAKFCICTVSLLPIRQEDWPTPFYAGFAVCSFECRCSCPFQKMPGSVPVGPNTLTNRFSAFFQSRWTTNGMATARNVGTAGWIFFINFARRVRVHTNICLVYTKFNALSYTYKLSFLGGAAYRFTLFGALSQHNWTLPY